MVDARNIRAVYTQYPGESVRYIAQLWYLRDCERYVCGRCTHGSMRVKFLPLTDGERCKHCGSVVHVLKGERPMPGIKAERARVVTL
jgi:DNA-directed RNA polymerase subunit RPC12/RpoP